MAVTFEYMAMRNKEIAEAFGMSLDQDDFERRKTLLVRETDNTLRLSADCYEYLM
jgi:hypothetical protein